MHWAIQFPIFDHHPNPMTPAPHVMFFQISLGAHLQAPAINLAPEWGLGDISSGPCFKFFHIHMLLSLYLQCKILPGALAPYNRAQTLTAPTMIRGWVM